MRQLTEGALSEDWERVRTAKPSDLADVIRTGGLAQYASFYESVSPSYVSC